MSRRYPAVEGELEDELAKELETELEDELGGLARELEDELEDEDFAEYEDELELEDELGGLARELEDELEDEDFAEYEDEFETVVRELEDEFELEDEDFANPPRRVYADAELMAELAFAAEESETEEEAEAFLGALAPLVIRAAAPLVKRYAPTLIRGAVGLGRRLWRKPATRRLIRQVPRILGRTVRDIGRRYADGKPINARTISRSLVGHAVNAGRPAERRGSPARQRRGRPARGRSGRTRSVRARRGATARRAVQRRRGKARARRR